MGFDESFHLMRNPVHLPDPVSEGLMSAPGRPRRTSATTRVVADEPSCRSIDNARDDDDQVKLERNSHTLRSRKDHTNPGGNFTKCPASRAVPQGKFTVGLRGRRGAGLSTLGSGANHRPSGRGLFCYAPYLIE